MTTRQCRRLIPVLFVWSIAATASAQPIQWWKADATVKELSLTPDQSARIDGIFQASMIELRRQKGDLDKLEDKLSRLIEKDADEGQVTLQIDRVESARASLNKTRTVMLLHMRQILTPDQRMQLNVMRDRWNKDRDREPGRENTPKPETRKDSK